MTNPMTTTGDTIYSSSGSTPARLGIGTTGQVLTVAGGVPSWSSPAGGGTNWTLLNSGGTALTGASTITVSGISGKDKIMVIVSGGSSNSGAAYVGVRFNTDTGSNYYQYGSYATYDSTYSPSGFGDQQGANNVAWLFATSSGASSSGSGYLIMTGANSSGVKSYNSAGGAFPTVGTGQVHYNSGGYYDSASTISSISIFTNTGNLDAGTVFVYTSA
jgi:hypothetical protein